MQVQPTVVDILPANMEAEIQKAKLQRAALEKLFKEILVQGTDFDRVPGTDKPTLLKSGAELLCQVFHLAPGKADIIQITEDFDTDTYSYMIGVPIYHRETGVLIAYGIGAANSREPKYRYRNIEEDGVKTKIENPDPAGQQNTLVKMAAKRAFIDGVLKATGASRMFTQDVEDFMLPEKASSKQINYIKSLLKNDNPLAVISQMLGRDATWDDITREEAATVIEQLKSKAQEQPHSQQRNPKSSQDPQEPASQQQIRAIRAIAKEAGVVDDDDTLAYILSTTGMQVNNLEELTKVQASDIITALNKAKKAAQNA